MFALHPLFSDGCVLPVERPIRLFGTAADGSRITARLLVSGSAEQAEASCVAADGRFELTLAAQPAPARDCGIVLCDGNDTVTVRDVALGWVFLAGGQSNMELSLQNAEGGRTLCEEQNDAQIRFYGVPRESRLDRAVEAQKGCRWQKCLPGCCGEMSAVARYFAE